MSNYELDKDSTKRIGNTIYSIILGFIVNKLLFTSTFPETFAFINISWFSVIMIVYFFLDWFSFNVLTEIDKTYESIELFFTILFVIFLGWLIAFSNAYTQLSDGQKDMYVICLSCYLIFSVILFFLRLEITLEKKIKEIKIIKYDMLVKILMICMFFIASKNNMLNIYWLLGGMFAISIFKLLRYVQLTKTLSDKKLN